MKRDYLIRWRKERFLSQRDAGDLCKISFRTLQRYEVGGDKTGMTLVMQELISSGYDVPLEELQKREASYRGARERVRKK